jgi:hypothetical protein
VQVPVSSADVLVTGSSTVEQAPAPAPRATTIPTTMVFVQESIAFTVDARSSAREHDNDPADRVHTISSGPRFT